MPEEASRADVLAAIAATNARLDSLQGLVQGELRAVHQEVSGYALATERRLTAIETDRDRWFKDTWPSAAAVAQALEERTRALERSALTSSALAAVHDRIDRKESADKEARDGLAARVGFLEVWRWKMVGLAAGVGLSSSVVGWLVVRLLEKK